MAGQFPGGRLVFDAAGKTAVKLMVKTWVKSLGITDVGAYFYLNNPERDLQSWMENANVSARGYMLGYNRLKDPAISGFFRFLSRIGDDIMKMRIVRLDFHRAGD